MRPPNRIGQDHVIANSDEPRLEGSVLIVEDHAVLAQGLGAALQGVGLTVSTTDADPPDRFGEVLDEARPDVVLLDLWLGTAVGSGLGLIPAILSAGARIVILTASEDPVLLASCVEAGAFDLANKSEPFASVLAKVQGALDGGPGLGEVARQEYLAELARARAADFDRLAPFARLTPREASVLRALIEGRSAQEIATAGPVALATVRTQIRAILHKLGVSSQLAAVALARRAGWPEDPAERIHQV